MGGEVGSKEVVAETCCSTMIACERTLELVRATQWCQVTDDFARRNGYLPVLAFCRITYATVLIATGASYQRLPVAGCERWDGAGIYYSCTAVHARSCRDGRAAVVGGGNSAGQAVMFLAENTAGARLLLRGGDLRNSLHARLSREQNAHRRGNRLSTRGKCRW